MRNPQFYVSGKRPISWCHRGLRCSVHTLWRWYEVVGFPSPRNPCMAYVAQTGSRGGHSPERKIYIIHQVKSYCDPELHTVALYRTTMQNPHPTRPPTTIAANQATIVTPSATKFYLAKFALTNQASLKKCNKVHRYLGETFVDLISQALLDLRVHGKVIGQKSKAGARGFITRNQEQHALRLHLLLTQKKWPLLITYFFPR